MALFKPKIVASRSAPGQKIVRLLDKSDREIGLITFTDRGILISAPGYLDGKKRPRDTVTTERNILGNAVIVVDFLKET